MLKNAGSWHFAPTISPHRHRSKFSNGFLSTIFCILSHWLTTALVKYITSTEHTSTQQSTHVHICTYMSCTEYSACMSATRTQNSAGYSTSTSISCTSNYTATCASTQHRHSHTQHRYTNRHMSTETDTTIAEYTKRHTCTEVSMTLDRTNNHIHNLEFPLAPHQEQQRTEKARRTQCSIIIIEGVYYLVVGCFCVGVGYKGNIYKLVCALVG